jgi:hypothetical protein
MAERPREVKRRQTTENGVERCTPSVEVSPVSIWSIHLFQVFQACDAISATREVGRSAQILEIAAANIPRPWKFGRA